MSEDYLCDLSGPPDPEIEHFERLLAPRRFDRPAPTIPSRWRLVRWPLTAAACALLAAGVRLIFGGGAANTPWHAETVAGIARVGNAALTEARSLRPDEWVATDSTATVRLVAAGVATVIVSPGSKVRLRSVTESAHSVDIAYGRVSVNAVTPPRGFVIHTPIATITDLGCDYDIEVEQNGTSRVHVLAGEVEFASSGKAIVLPHCAVCDARPAAGLGIPRFDDAPESLVKAARRFDLDPADDRALGLILTTSRPRDTFTLFHMLPKVAESRRGEVLDRIRALSPATSRMPRGPLMALDPVSMNELSRALRSGW